MVEGQPRHQRGVRGQRRGREEAAHQLLEIHGQVAVREHHPGRLARRTRAVLQVRQALRANRFQPRAGRIGVQVQPVDLDELRRRRQVGLRHVVTDVDRGCRRRQHHRGLGVGEHRTDAFVTRPGERQRQRHRDQTGLQRTQERQDVLQALRGQDHRPVAGRSVPPQLHGHVHRPSRQLRPRQALRDTGGIAVVMGERESDLVGTQTGTTVQHRQDRRLRRCRHDGSVSARRVIRDGTGEGLGLVVSHGSRSTADLGQSISAGARDADRRGPICGGLEGHQFALPTSAAMAGTVMVRTTNVSSRMPTPITNPP